MYHVHYSLQTYPALIIQDVILHRIIITRHHTKTREVLKTLKFLEHVINFAYYTKHPIRQCVPSILIITLSRTQQYNAASKKQIRKDQQNPRRGTCLSHAIKDIHIRTPKRKTTKPASPYSYREHKATSQELFLPCPWQRPKTVLAIDY
jgi:hypothetical protein